MRKRDEKVDMLKKILKIFGIITVLVAIASVIAGVVDRVQEKRRNRKHRPYGMYEKYFKRPLDFFLSSMALIVLSPVLLVVAILVRLKLGSPVMFSQERPGRDENPFTLWKYRSMTDDRDEKGKLLPDEERLTKFGDTLRRTSIDELPELISILRGDMSLIGPRPLMPNYVPYYTEKEHHRHDVRPGLTGMAQVSGRNALTWEERFFYDLKYVKKTTFLGDLKILFKTMRKVVKKEDIIVRGTEESIPDFDAERRMKQDKGKMQ